PPKNRVLRNQRRCGVAIGNAVERRAMPRGEVARPWRSSAARPVGEGAFLDGDRLVIRLDGHERHLPRTSLKLQGLPNIENALAAWLAARAAGVDDVDVQIAFGSFEGLPHRMVLVRELDGVTYVNDSKGTNVDAALKS